MNRIDNKFSDFSEFSASRKKQNQEEILYRLKKNELGRKGK